MTLNPSSQARDTQSGFTLVETLVAVFILSMISAAGASLLLGSATSSRQIQEKEADARELDMAVAMFRSDMDAMTTRAVRPEWGAAAPSSLRGEQPRGAAPFLEFVRNGWIETDLTAKRSNLVHVSYRLEEGRLLRTVKVRPDAVEQTPSIERVLFEDVDRLDIRFRRGGDWSQSWYGDQPDTLDILPQLIELSLEFGDGSELTLAAVSGGPA